VNPVLAFLLLLGAAVCFGLAAAKVPGRPNWIGLGLLLWVLIPLWAAAQALH
jgi:hypothetical protein